MAKRSILGSADKLVQCGAYPGKLLGFWLGCIVLPAALHAGMIQTTDNRTFFGNVQLGQAGLVIALTNGVQQSVPLDRVRLAQLGVVLSDASALPRGWQAEDICDVRGTTTEKDGRYVLRVTGGVVKETKSQQAVHFAYRIMRSEGELSARIENVSGHSPSLAGLMFRESLEAPAGFILLGVTPDQKLQMQVREGGWQRLQVKDLGKASLPLWLKLVKQEKIISAYRSQDGKIWQRLEQYPLYVRTEPFPDGSGEWKPKVYAGLAMAGPCTNALCAATFSEVGLTVRGLLGTYFADENFSKMRFARPDSELKFNWGRTAPALELPPEHFSVRWVGKIEPKASGPYRFSYDIGGQAKLWVNGVELIEASKSTQPVTKREPAKKKSLEVVLNKGQRYDIKIEWKSGEGDSHLRLGWGTGPLSAEIIPSERLSYTYNANSPEEYAEGGQTEGLGPKGVYLRNGSYIAGPIRTADDGLTRVLFAGTNELAILNSKIARIVFRRSAKPLPVDRADQTGIVLRNGDFFESEYKGVKDQAVIMSSVLFGQRKFSLQNIEAIALLLNKCSPEPARYEVKLNDGSVLRANNLRMAANAAVLEETILGELKVPGKEVVEIKKM